MEATLIRLGLFVHIASAIGLFVGLGVELLSGHLVTRAEDTSQVRMLSRAALIGGRLAALSLVGLLFSGPDLASRMGFFEGSGVTGWIAVAIVMIVLIGAGGGMLHRRMFRDLGIAAAASPTAALGDDIRDLLARPAPWVSMHAAVGAGLATVWLMSNKPSGVLDSAVVAMTGIGLGLIAGGTVVARLRTTAAAA